MLADLLHDPKMSKFVLASVRKSRRWRHHRCPTMPCYSARSNLRTVDRLVPINRTCSCRKIGSTAFHALPVPIEKCSMGTPKGLYAECVADQKALNLSVTKKKDRPTMPPIVENWRNYIGKTQIGIPFPKNAKITAQLALSDFTQNKIKSL